LCIFEKKNGLYVFTFPLIHSSKLRLSRAAKQHVSIDLKDIDEKFKCIFLSIFRYSFRAAELEDMFHIK